MIINFVKTVCSKQFLEIVTKFYKGLFSSKNYVKTAKQPTVLAIRGDFKSYRINSTFYFYKL